jgi:hypothetical protein
VRRSQILYENTPPLTRKCIPLCKPSTNGNITFWARRQSSILIKSICNSYTHRGNYRMTTIKSVPHTYNSSISTSSIRQGEKIVFLTPLVSLPLLHSPLCSIPVGMRPLSGPKFISMNPTSSPPTSSWVQAQMSHIFTFRMDCYAI